MAIYELGLHEDYVRTWGVVEGLREILQNALDQERIDPSNKMYIAYNEEESLLMLGNKNSILEKDTLLLGYTTKADDPDTIGQFGEGYKLALLVLQRAGKEVIVRNNGKREEWLVSLKKSRRYNNQNILTVDIKKLPIFKKKPNHNLVFEIKGVTKEEYEQLQAMRYTPSDQVVSTPYGEIDFSEERKGEIYYKGLKIMTSDKFRYGYNVRDVQIAIGRDRNVASEMNITYATTILWSHLADDPMYKEEIERLLNNVDMMDIYVYSNNSIEQIMRMFDPHQHLYESFMKKLSEQKTDEYIVGTKIYRTYGEEIPESEKDMEVVYVSPSIERLLKRNSRYNAYEEQVKHQHIAGVSKTKEEYLDRHLKEIVEQYHIPQEAYSRLVEVIGEYAEPFSEYQERKRQKEKEET